MKACTGKKECHGALKKRCTGADKRGTHRLHSWAENTMWRQGEPVLLLDLRQIYSQLGIASSFFLFFFTQIYIYISPTDGRSSASSLLLRVIRNASLSFVLITPHDSFPPALFVQFSLQLEAKDYMAIGGLTWITLPPTSFSLYSSATDCFFFRCYELKYSSAAGTYAFTLYLSVLSTEYHQQSQNDVCQYS